MNTNTSFSNFFYQSNLKEALDLDSSATKSILVIDYCGVRDIYPVMDELAEGLLPTKLFYLSALAARADFKNKIKSDLVNIIRPPDSVWYNDRNRLNSVIGREKCEGLKEISLLKRLLKKSLSNDKSDIDSGIVENQIKTAYYFTLLAIRTINPELVIIWNQFHPLSKTAIRACENSGVQYSFFEYGVIPGTLNFDFKGQMGESAVATESEKFSALPLNNSDLDAAKKSLEYLLNTGLNRKVLPPLKGLENSIGEIAGGRKIILFAGHNDPSSGLIPYTEKVSKSHSPIFTSSHSAAKYLISKARRNNWLLLYKPHPHDNKGCFIPNTFDHIMVTDSNINECIDVADVTVTVLSQTSSIALIRKKPVVMLGYNHLRDSGAVYQAENIHDIESKINMALENGLTEDMLSSWHNHVSRILKYYSYSYGSNNPDEIGAQQLENLAAALNFAITAKKFSDFQTFETVPKI
tara:strand:+ start:426 stop:1823 length:1398 start_codon:yes stop_codon:yes gene_type:complete